MTMPGRVCLVTGATSGIGHATAQALAGLGASVVILGRKDIPSAQGVAALVAGADGSRRHPVSYPCSSDAAHTIAPRGATSTAAAPRPYSNMSRSPCLVRSTPESWASVETTCSTPSSALTVSDSSYVTSM